MKWGKLIFIFIMALLLCIPVIATITSTEPDTTSNKQTENVQKVKKKPTTKDTKKVVWGVDTASDTTKDLYMCIRENFGDPVVFGRYLGEKEGVSNGLTKAQVNLIHSEGGKILLVYNQFEDATGYENGVAQAKEAIRLAEKLGVPKGVAIFADIEPGYPVDSDFIRGWYDGISATYKPGIYGIFSPEKNLFKAFNNVDKNIKSNTYIWTAAPNIGITSEAKAPKYQPEAPKGSVIFGWQYGIDAKACNIDTNLFDADLLGILWGGEK